MRTTKLNMIFHWQCTVKNYSYFHFSDKNSKDCVPMKQKFGWDVWVCPSQNPTQKHMAQRKIAWFSFPPTSNYIFPSFLFWKHVKYLKCPKKRYIHWQFQLINVQTILHLYVKQVLISVLSHTAFLTCMTIPTFKNFHTRTTQMKLRHAARDIRNWNGQLSILFVQSFLKPTVNEWTLNSQREFRSDNCAQYMYKFCLLKNQDNHHRISNTYVSLVSCIFCLQ